MDYNRVALFVRVVRAGSFTAAAAEVGLPKSSVSRAVSRLEKDLGVQLLQRTTRALALTEAGQTYYDSVRPSVTALDEAEASVREQGSTPSGTVRLTTAPDVDFLAPALARFSREHPGIRLELVITSRYVDLVTENVDIALRAGKLMDSSLVARRIGGTELGLLASPAYLRRRGKPKSLDDLAEHTWVLYRAVQGRATLDLTGPDGTERNVEVRGSLVADDMMFCRAAVENGAGIGLLPILGSVKSLAAGTLEQVLPGWTYRGSSLHVVLPSGRHVPARVALVRDFLVEVLGKQFHEAQARCDKARRGTGAATAAAVHPRA